MKKWRPPLQRKRKSEERNRGTRNGRGSKHKSLPPHNIKKSERTVKNEKEKGKTEKAVTRAPSYKKEVERKVGD